MPIDAAPIVPQEVVLRESDPSGESKVWIRPATNREDLERGQLTKDRTYGWDAELGMITRVNYNLAELQAKEMWITYDHAEITLLVKDEDGKVKEVTPFRPKSDMTYDQFIEALAMMPKSAIREWYRGMVRLNPDWTGPF